MPALARSQSLEPSTNKVLSDNRYELPSPLKLTKTLLSSSPLPPPKKKPHHHPMHQLPIFAGLLPFLLHRLRQVSQQQPAAWPPEWEDRWALPRGAQDITAWAERHCGQTSAPLSSLRARGISFKPWLESPHVTCSQHTSELVKLFSYGCITSLHPGHSPRRG